MTMSVEATHIALGAADDTVRCHSCYGAPMTLNTPIEAECIECGEHKKYPYGGEYSKLLIRFTIQR